MNQLNVKNVSGGDHPIPQKGEIANGTAEDIDLGLVLFNPNERNYLSAEVTAGRLEVRYLGTLLTAAQVDALDETVTAYYEEANPPLLDRLDIAVTGAMAAAGGKVKLEGRNLEQGQAFDSITITEGGAQIVLTALKPGVSGITVELIKGGGGASVAFNPGTGALVIDVGAAGDTDDNIATLVNANLAATDGYVRAVSSSGGSFTAIQAAAPMTGGTGNYTANMVMANGAEALPANTPGISAPATWTDSAITCKTVAAGAATDVATAWVKSNGLNSNALSTVLV